MLRQLGLLSRLGVLSCLVAVTGCSSLGFSLYPEGEFLTNEAQQVLNNAPRGRDLPRELSQTVLPAHFIQPGDSLLLEPVALDAKVMLPADQVVMADGSLDLGGFGRLVVAGMTLETAEELIEQTILTAGAPATAVNVRLLEPVHRFYVLGAVPSPGSYPLIGHETVLDAILSAGGLTADAAPCKILLARPTPPSGCRVVLPICYREIVQLGDTTTNYQMQPGDRIFVSSRSCLDDLMFWRASRGCSHCQGRQVPCCDPGLANYTNPIAFLPQAIREHFRQPAAEYEVEPQPEIISEPPVPAPQLGELKFDTPIEAIP